MSLGGHRRQEKLALLVGSPLFADLHAEELELLADLCQELEFSAGQTIVEEGVAGDSVFIVEDGKVEIFRTDTSQHSRKLTTLERGQFFGEMSVIEKSTRSATVIAATDCKLLTLSTDDLYSFAKIFVNGFTLVIINVARVLSQRLRNTTGELMKGSQEL